ncbi:MAG: hypothetical protein HW389_2517 [Bacteroidetes bacterium]|nr:hypothetical protein [Bacteroidota bacterium]
MVLEDPFRATSKTTEVNERSEVNFYVILRIPPFCGGIQNHSRALFASGCHFENPAERSETGSTNCPRTLCVSGCNFQHPDRFVIGICIEPPQKQKEANPIVRDCLFSFLRHILAQHLSLPLWTQRFRVTNHPDVTKM